MNISNTKIGSELENKKRQVRSELEKIVTSMEKFELGWFPRGSRGAEESA